MSHWPREFSDDAIDILLAWQEGENNHLQALDDLWRLAERDMSLRYCQERGCESESVFCPAHAIAASTRCLECGKENDSCPECRTEKP